MGNDNFGTFIRGAVLFSEGTVSIVLGMRLFPIFLKVLYEIGR